MVAQRAMQAPDFTNRHIVRATRFASMLRQDTPLSKRRRFAQGSTLPNTVSECPCPFGALVYPTQYTNETLWIPPHAQNKIDCLSSGMTLNPKLDLKRRTSCCEGFKLRSPARVLLPEVIGCIFASSHASSPTNPIAQNPEQALQEQRFQDSLEASLLVDYREWQVSSLTYFL